MGTPDYLRVKFGEEVWHDKPGEDWERDFFDRIESYQKALAILRSPDTRRAVWLVGERRAGKTSLLKLLLSKCQKEGAIAIEVPWQLIHSSADFYQEFLHKLEQENNTQQRAVDVSEESFWRVLEGSLKARGWSRLVIGVDELDSILLEQVDERSRKEILGVLMRLVTETPNAKVIVASIRPADRIEQLRASPLVSRSEEIFLTPFDAQDLQEMLQVLAPGLTQEEIEQIIYRSGGWPYCAKAILYHLLQIPADTPSRLERASSQAVEAIHSTCVHLYRHHWDKNEKQALWLLMNKDRMESEEFQVLDAPLRSAFQGLVRRGYLIEEGGTYRFRVTLIAAWLKGWTQRDVEEDELQIPSLLRKIDRTTIWSSEPGEQSMRVTREELRQRGF